MATHRSIGMPDLGPPIQLGDHLRLKTVVATKRLEHDIVPLIDASPAEASEPERRPTHLLWYRSDDGFARLSKVAPFLYAAVEQLQQGPQPVAALMVDWAQDGERAVDYDRLVHTLSEARTLRILETV
jgi:hypothetical protein